MHPANQEAPAGDGGLLPFWSPVATVVSAGGAVVSRLSFDPGNPRCQAATVLDVMGSGFTETSGSCSFSLAGSLCPAPTWSSLEQPVGVVVTPVAATPVFATVGYELVGAGDAAPFAGDLTITVHTWGPGGAPEGDVRFDWRCRVVSRPAVLRGAAG